MSKKKIIIVITSLALILAVSGCGRKPIPPQNGLNTQSGQESNQNLPEGHPDISGENQPSTSSSIDGKTLVDNINKEIDAKYPGDWKVSGTTLSKGDYTENDNYKIADLVGQLYPGSMVSIFVGETRVSSTVKQNGKPVLDYPVPPEVAQVMKSGELLQGAPSSLGSATYQKFYVPLKSGDKTVGVLTISVM